MTLKSALEDLLETTLAGVAGIVGKIEYVSSLREAPGRAYCHWGLQRVHGEEAAQRALLEAHQALFLKLLRTSLRTLRDDVEVSSGGSQISEKQYVEKLRANLPSLLPPDLGGGSARHLSSVLHALSVLASSPARTRSDAIPRA